MSVSYWEWSAMWSVDRHKQLTRSLQRQNVFSLLLPKGRQVTPSKLSLVFKSAAFRTTGAQAKFCNKEVKCVRFFRGWAQLKRGGRHINLQNFFHWFVVPGDNGKSNDKITCNILLQQWKQRQSREVWDERFPPTSTIQWFCEAFDSEVLPQLLCSLQELLWHHNTSTESSFLLELSLTAYLPRLCH